MRLLLTRQVRNTVGRPFQAVQNGLERPSYMIYFVAGLIASIVRKLPTVWTAVLVLCACMLAGGCCGANKVYRAASLPAELVAPHRENVEAIDLSRLNNLSVSSEMIDRGDVLELTMVTDFRDFTATTTPVRVGEDGRANIPLIGPVAVAGMEMADAEQAVAAAGIERGVFRTPYITLTMKRQRKNRVTVTGAVKEPGVYELPRGNSTLLAALVAAGGLVKEAGPDVEIRRPVGQSAGPARQTPSPPQAGENGGPTLTSYQPEAADSPAVVRVNLVSATQQHTGGYYVDDGSSVSVGKRSLKPIQVLGLVDKPGQFEMPLNQDLYVMDALAMAGGRRTPVADRVIVLREVPGRPEPARIVVSYDEAKHNGRANLRLAPGDVISVEDTPVTFLWDALRTFVRVGISGGMTLF